MQALTFSGDGVWLLSAGKDPEQNVVIWDVASGAVLTSGTTSQPVRALAWRHNTSLPAFLTLLKVWCVVYSMLYCLKVCSTLKGNNMAAVYNYNHVLCGPSVCQAWHPYDHVMPAVTR